MIGYMIIAGLAVLLIGTLFYCSHIRAAISRYHVLYIDSQGVDKNPPNYLEVEQGKTLNIKIDKKYHLTIQHFSFFENLFYIEKIKVLYNALSKFLNEIKSMPLSDSDRKRKELMISGFYMEIGKLIYKICRRRAKGLGFRLAFWKKYMDDTDWAYQVAEEMVRFWLYTKKKLEMLPAAISSPRILGELHLWNSLDMDLQGNVSQRPRFDFSLN